MANQSQPTTKQNSTESAEIPTVGTKNAIETSVAKDSAESFAALSASTLQARLDSSPLPNAQIALNVWNLWLTIKGA